MIKDKETKITAKPKLKEEKVEKTSLHPAAESWNTFIRTMEEARLAWQKHQEVYLQTRSSIGTWSIQTQKLLAGIHHRQRFFDALDYLSRFANSGFLSQLIEKEASND